MLEPISVTVSDGNTADALVVNDSGVLVWLQRGLLTRPLTNGAHISSEPLDFDLPSIPVGALADVQLGVENPKSNWVTMLSWS